MESILSYVCGFRQFKTRDASAVIKCRIANRRHFREIHGFQSSTRIKSIRTDIRYFREVDACHIREPTENILPDACYRIMGHTALQVAIQQMLIHGANITELCINIGIRLNGTRILVPASKLIIRRILLCCVCRGISRIKCPAAIRDIVYCLQHTAPYIEANCEGTNAGRKCSIDIPIFHNSKKSGCIPFTTNLQRPYRPRRQTQVLSELNRCM